MVELRGSLSSIGLPAIVQLIVDLHHSGNLEVTRGASRGALAFDRGRLIAAAIDEKQGLEALTTCLSELCDGEFNFVEGVPNGERTLDLGPGDLHKLLAAAPAPTAPPPTS